MDTISWASPTEPLPMVRDPRAVFDQLFGLGGTPEAARARSASADRSILDWVADEFARLRPQLDPVRPRAARATTSTTSAKSSGAFEAIEARNTSGEVRELPDAPAGVPDDFDEHVKLMFDLQAIAFAVGHHARLRVQDGPRRLRPRLSEERRQHGLPSRVASRRPRRSHPAVPPDQQVPRQPGAVLPREAEEHARRRRLAARPQPDRLRLADGRRRTCTITCAARCSSPAMPTAS